MFTVIIPLYNKAPFIQRSLGSVLAQTVADFEVVIVDDGSTDDGRQRAEALADGRVRILSQANQGISGARNAGIRAARGDYLAYLDADDEWAPDFLERIGRLMEEFPQAEAFGTSYWFLRPDGSRSRAAGWDRLGRGELNYLRAMGLYGVTPIHTSSLVQARATVERCGYFEPGILCEDHDYMARLALVCRYAYDPAPALFFHCQIENSHTDRLRAGAVGRRYSKPHLERMQEWLEAGRVPEALREDARLFVQGGWLHTARYALEDGHGCLARGFLRGQTGRRATLYRLLSRLPDPLLRAFFSLWRASRAGRGPRPGAAPAAADN